MKIIFFLALFICSFLLEANTKIPRQKVMLSGAVLPGTPKAISIDKLEALFQKRELKLYDPYNKNIQTTFYGFPLDELFKKFASKDVTKISVKAIDGYKVYIPKNNIASEKLFLSYRDQNGYLTVDRMGPSRIIAPFEGVIPKDVLLKLGVNWVWQVNEIEFLK
jgi:hypothetical protein